MKDALLSIFRHILTGLAGIGGLLVSKNLADPADADTLNAAGATLADAVAVIAAVVLSRALIWALGRLGSGKALPLVVGIGTGAGFLALCPPSCAPDQVMKFKQAAEAVPVQACYYDKNGNRICYSTKDGILVDLKSNK